MEALLVAGAGAALLSVLAVRRHHRQVRLRARDRLRAAPRVALPDLGRRLARVHGRVAEPGRLRAPATGRDVAAWRVVIEEEIGGAWHPRRIVDSADPFVLAADGLRAGVRGPFELLLPAERRAELDGRPRPTDATLRELCASAGLSLVDGRGLPRRFRFLERVLVAGAPVAVVGVAGPATATSRDGYRVMAPTRSIVGARRTAVLVCADPGLLNERRDPA